MSELLNRLKQLSSDKQRYALQNLPAHLHKSGDVKRMRELLADFNFIVAKTIYIKIGNLLEDYDIAPLGDDILNCIRGVLKKNAHIFDQCENLSDLCSTMYWRLLHIEELSSYLTPLLHNRCAPWLEPRFPLPDIDKGANLQTFIGHAGPVYTCIISPDDRVLVSGGEDNALKVWDIHTGQLCFSINEAIPFQRGSKISMNNRIIVAKTTDTLKVWDAKSGAEVFSISGDMGVVSADGRFIVSIAGINCTVWDGKNGQRSYTINTEHKINDCSVNQDGRRIVVAAGKELIVWDGESRRKCLQLLTHTQDITKCAVNADGCVAVSTTLWGEELKIWDAVSGEERFTIDCGYAGDKRGIIWGLSISSDGRFVAVASADKRLIVWDTQTGQEVFRVTEIGKLYDCAVSSDGRFIASASELGKLTVWDSASKDAHSGDISPMENATDCSMSADGQTIATVSNNSQLKVWDGKSGEVIFNSEEFTGHARSCAISPNGRFIIVGGFLNENFKVWDAQTGHIKSYTTSGMLSGYFGLSPLPIDEVYRIVINDNGTAVSTHGGNDKQPFTVYGHDGTVTSMQMTASYLKVWDASTGRHFATLGGHAKNIFGCAISSDGRIIASASEDKTLKVWDAKIGQERHTLVGHTGSVHACAVSRSGRRIVSASEDKTLKVWDIKTGQESNTLMGHRDSVRDCAISEDGKLVVSCSWDHTLRVWDAEIGACLTTMAFNGRLSSCDCSADARYIVAAGEGGVYLLQFINKQLYHNRNIAQRLVSFWKGSVNL